jgi:hypothetical protein
MNKHTLLDNVTQIPITYLHPFQFIGPPPLCCVATTFVKGSDSTPTST